MSKAQFSTTILLAITGALALSIIAFGLGRFAGYGDARAEFENYRHRAISAEVNNDLLRQELSECRAANAN